MNKNLLIVSLFGVFSLFSVFFCVSAEAHGIIVESATYGGNCGAQRGNVSTPLSRKCNGKSNCKYTVNYKVLGDPAPGCAKTFVVRYRCGNSGRVFEKRLSAEAGWGDKSVVLNCP